MSLNRRHFENLRSSSTCHLLCAIGLITLVSFGSSAAAASQATLPGNASPTGSNNAPSAKLPKSFSVYGNSTVPGGSCVAGSVTNEGLDARALVYFKDAGTQQPRWVTSIPVPKDFYQNRATHCIAMGDALYVLVQSDTSQRTSISQTLLNVVELSPATGKIISDRNADVPGVDAAYSSWVEKGNEGFHEDHGQVRISGHYFLMNDSEKRMPFTVSLPAHASK